MAIRLLTLRIVNFCTIVLNNEKGVAGENGIPGNKKEVKGIRASRS